MSEPRSGQLVAGLALMALSITASAGTIRYATWNISQLDHKLHQNQHHKGLAPRQRLKLIAKAMNQFDLVAVQNIRSEHIANRLNRAINSVSSARWDHELGPTIGKGSRKTHQGFFWRTSAIGISTNTYALKGHGHPFKKPPVSAVFTIRHDKSQFVATSIRVKRHTSELKKLTAYWGFLGQRYGKKMPIVLSGDFHASAQRPVFNKLTQFAVPIINSTRTTVPSHANGGRSFDNIWLDRSILSHHMPKSGVLKLVKSTHMSRKQVRHLISDHIPVYTYLSIPKSR